MAIASCSRVSTFSGSEEANPFCSYYILSIFVQFSVVITHGGDTVLIYASKYHDVPIVINVSGRYHMDKGIDKILGKDYMERIKENGFIDVKDNKGNIRYRVTEESLLQLLAIDMHAVCLSIAKSCRVFTVHGSEDEIAPLGDAFEFANIIHNYKLHIVEGADHVFDNHQSELVELVVNFIRESLQFSVVITHGLVSLVVKLEYDDIRKRGFFPGGDTVLIYASKYHDVPIVINVSGRYHMDKGIDKILGKDYMERIKENGFIDVKDNKGNIRYRVTEESLLQLLAIDMHAVCLSIAKSCRVFTVHGSEDEIAPLGDAFEFANIIHNYKLHIVEGADHVFDNHQSELVELVVNFIRESLQFSVVITHGLVSLVVKLEYDDIRKRGKYPVPCDRREFVATPCNRYACSMPSIAKSCRVFTVHGSEDEIAPLGDAFEFANIIHNYKLHIVEGADHVFDNHQSELVELVVNFIRESLQFSVVITHGLVSLVVKLEYDDIRKRGFFPGGDTVLIYASKYHDVPIVINVSGRYHMDKGIDKILGKDYMERIKENGFIDVKDNKGNIRYRVTEESLLQLLAIDMRAVCLSIAKSCRVFTVHGSEDEIAPLGDAFEFANIIHNYKLHIVEGADHVFDNHQSELVELVVNFIRESLQFSVVITHGLVSLVVKLEYDDIRKRGFFPGGDTVLIYASKYHDVPIVINVSGRYHMDKGIDKILGKDYMERIKENGFIDVKDNKGNIRYRVTEESLLQLLAIDMHAVCLSIAKSCRVFTVHGSEDEIAPLGDAFEFANIIHNYKLHIVEGADHVFDNHQSELVELVVNFIRESLQFSVVITHGLVSLVVKLEYDDIRKRGFFPGGDTVLIYASKYHDVPIVINVSGRYHMDKGIDKILGKDYMERIKENGFIDVKDNKGNIRYRVTEESLLQLLAIDMHAVCLSIAKSCRVFTVHGSEDEIAPLGDAFEFANIIHNYKLHIVEGADHVFDNHQSELVELVVNFIRESLQVHEYSSTAICVLPSPSFLSHHFGPEMYLFCAAINKTKSRTFFLRCGYIPVSFFYENPSLFELNPHGLICSAGPTSSPMRLLA
ncbi:hypothetical protein C5167_026429 [Papaver somniferum]|nr:hypothetical protein C5167_026429 [Papaver somniferum]